jgi:hypothetical protein
MFMLALKISAVGSADDLRADWAYGRQGLRLRAGLHFPPWDTIFSLSSLCGETLDLVDCISGRDSGLHS